MTMSNAQQQPAGTHPHPGNENTPLSSQVQTALHPNVYKIAMVCWAGLMAIFWVTFWASAEALFIVVISTGFALMFFGIPFLMSRMAPKNADGLCTFRTFLRAPFGTLNGQLPGFEVLLQVIVVPLCVALGGIAISFMILADRLAH